MYSMIQGHKPPPTILQAALLLKPLFLDMTNGSCYCMWPESTFRARNMSLPEDIARAW